MNSSDETTCVVLAPPGWVDPDGLEAELTERGWEHVVHHNAVDAMSDVCLRERASHARAAWGLAAARSTMLLVVEPDRWDCMDDLAAALQRYVPDIRVLRLEGGSLPLDNEAHAAGPAAAPAPRADPPAPAPHPAARAAPGAPHLVLRGAEELEDLDDAAVEPESDGDEVEETPGTLTPQELEMLLDASAGGES